jgi:CRISPR-associated protein Cmr2
MSKTKILNFSLGPVQGFITRGRKTRDFWTGSFLLSYLAGQAMAEVLKQEGGSLILPAVAENKDKIADPLLQAIMDHNNGKGKKTPFKGNHVLIATLPNRFRAMIPIDFDPDKCVQVIKKEWHRLTQKIWDRFLAPVTACGNSTAEIWRRQTKNYWEISWVLGENPAVLEQRKNWRTYLPSMEPGDKCTLFGDLQELSGYLRIHENKKQKTFWKAVREQVGIYDLEENERLCAIALVKRLFPRVAAEIFYQVPTGYPSTPYLAAVNWLGQVAENEPEKARLYANRASRLPGARGHENPELFPTLQKVLAKHPHAKEFTSLDGNCFFKTALENHNLWDKPKGTAADTEELRKKLIEKLADLNTAPPSPFYAMLLMDGDRLGALLQKHPAKTELISGALNKFSLKVPFVIETENGITVFAGGDDVLALLPLENAMAAATSLRHVYLESFTDEISQATISGAIVYAHFTTPLTEVYHEAQRLLTEVAKDKTGRDSLAITVWKSAGKVLTWSAPWEFILDQKRKVNIIEDFKQSLQKEISAEEKQIEFSNSFFYNIQSRLALFYDEKAEFSLSEDNLEALLTAEYISSRSAKTTYEEARNRMQQLLKICRRYWRDQDGNLCRDPKKLQLESIFLVKFLMEKGVEG